MQCTMNEPNLITLPTWDLTLEKAVSFELLWQECSAINRPIDYLLPYPKHEFLDFLSDQKGVFLHGSNRDDLEVLHPIRRSSEFSSKGSINAVYAIVDGITSIFYAILKREGFKGTSTNLLVTEPRPEGGINRSYHFSVDGEWLNEGAWCSGAVYVLPKTTFQQLPHDDGRPSQEWGSDVSVIPLARLLVTPADFPFLNQVEARAVDAVDRLTILLTNFVKQATRVITIEDGFEFYVLKHQQWESQASELIELCQNITPTAKVLFAKRSDSSALLRIVGNPLKHAVALMLGVDQKTGLNP
jgi:hypothetical protein